VKRRIEILPRALADAMDARRWYDEQREGLGEEFEEAFEAVLVGIARFPEIYPKVVHGVRRCLMGHFPYGIFYETPADDLIIVVAILHASRDPAIWPE
jgi:plasmid stabilization system protein ParE